MSEFLSTPLGADHRVDGFNCGKGPLTSWLHDQARRAQTAGTARTYVWTRPLQPDVLAYFAVAPTQVARADLPAAGLAGGFSVIPGYLLARLALDRELQGQGLGSELLLDALSRKIGRAHV